MFFPAATAPLGPRPRLLHLSHVRSQSQTQVQSQTGFARQCDRSCPPGSKVHSRRMPSTRVYLRVVRPAVVVHSKRYRRNPIRESDGGDFVVYCLLFFFFLLLSLLLLLLPRVPHRHQHAMASKTQPASQRAVATRATRLTSAEKGCLLPISNHGKSSKRQAI